MARYITVSILALILLLVALVLAFQGPGHIQIRELEIELPSYSQLQQAFAGIPENELPSKIEYLNTATQETPFGVLGHPGILISWDSGQSFLIDTGMNPQEAEKFGEPLEWLGAGPIETFGAIEQQMGQDVARITGLGFTHLHSDHTAGVVALCDAVSGQGTAPVVFQTQNQSHIHNHFTTQGQAWIKVSSCGKRTLGDDLLKAVPGFPGLFVVDAGGHTPGSSVFVTRFKGKTRVFAGDLSNTMLDIHEDKDKGWAYSYLLIPEDTKLLAKWRQWLKAMDEREDLAVLVAHDIRAYQNSDLQPWSNGQESLE